MNPSCHTFFVQKVCKIHVQSLSDIRTAQYQKFETNIPRKGIVRTQSQFPHSGVCERFIYFHDRAAYSAAGNMYIYIFIDSPWA